MGVGLSYYSYGHLLQWQWKLNTLLMHIMAETAYLKCNDNYSFLTTKYGQPPFFAHCWKHYMGNVWELWVQCQAQGKLPINGSSHYWTKTLLMNIDKANQNFYIPWLSINVQSYWSDEEQSTCFGNNYWSLKVTCGGTCISYVHVIYMCDDICIS